MSKSLCLYKKSSSYSVHKNEWFFKSLKTCKAIRCEVYEVLFFNVNKRKEGKTRKHLLR